MNNILIASIFAISFEQAPVHDFGICMREGAKLVGEDPVLIGKATGPPLSIRDVKPNYPETRGKTKGMGMWIGEVLIGRDGKVVRVWPTREVQFTPPFPMFNQAIVDALQQWEYHPIVRESRTVPFCMTTSMNINWR